MGLAPMNRGFADRCVSYFTTAPYQSSLSKLPLVRKLSRIFDNHLLNRRSIFRTMVQEELKPGHGTNI